MPKELITSRRDHDRDEPISGLLVEWGQWGEQVQVLATADVRPEPHKRQYIVVDLKDREACNALIRTIRKARDQAFGKDE